MASPGDSRSCACPATSPRARANGARSHIDSKKRCYACNEIKLLVKEFGTDRTARDGTLALQDVRRRSQNNEEDR
jgi:hypothetical protein